MSVLTAGRFGGVTTPFTLNNLIRATDQTFLKVIFTSILIATATALLSLLIGFPTALFISRLSRKWQIILIIAIILPYWTNFLVRTYAWLVLLNNEGIINKFLKNIGLIDQPIEMLYTPLAVIVGMTYLYLPLMILPIYAALEKVDKNLVEASLDLGSSAWKSLKTISIPLAMPGILIGLIFVFVPSMGNFVVPELLGGGKTVMIGNLVRDQFLKARDWPFGATFALILTIILVILISIQSRVSKKVNLNA
ncbi:MAG: ABC transporter permease [Candidatus Nanopelagicales bacterium]|jgi:spermidine/putrescine transport system permease protein